MNTSVKRALVYLSALVIGYALGIYDGASVNSSIPVAPLLLLLFLTPLLLAKLSGFFLWNRISWGNSGAGPDDAEYPAVPRPPKGRPPVLSARERLP